MATWHEITRDPEYQELTPEGKSLVKKGFFDRVIAADPEYQTFSEDTKKAIFDDFWQTPDDTGQGYVTSMLGAAGRGFGEMVPGAIEGVGALTGSEGLREFGQDVRGGLEDISPVNPIYGESIPVKLAGVGGQVGSMLATAGAGGLAGKALGGVGAATTGMRAAPLASAFLQGSAEGAREAEQYGMTGPEAYLRTLAGGATEAGTELLPFGMAAETSLAKRLLTGAPRTGTFLGAVGSEAGEEGLGQIASNIATKTLAPAGVETPDITAGALEAAAYGAAGGAMLGGVNALISTPPERQTQIQQDLQAEAGAIPKDTVPDQTNEEKMAAMEKGGVTVVSPDGKTAVIAPEPSMPDPAEVAKTIGETSVEQLAATGNKASAAAQKGFNAILAETLGETAEPTIQPEQEDEEVGVEVTPLSEGAERVVTPEEESLAAKRRADLLSAAADVAKGKTKAQVSPAVTAMVTPQPVETQEDAAPEIPLEESLRQEPQNRIESREAEETILGDSLLRSKEGEVEEEVRRKLRQPYASIAIPDLEKIPSRDWMGRRDYLEGKLRNNQQERAELLKTSKQNWESREYNENARINEVAASLRAAIQDMQLARPDLEAEFKAKSGTKTESRGEAEIIRRAKGEMGSAAVDVGGANGELRRESETLQRVSEQPQVSAKLGDTTSGGGKIQPDNRIIDVPLLDAPPDVVLDSWNQNVSPPNSLYQVGIISIRDIGTQEPQFSTAKTIAGARPKTGTFRDYIIRKQGWIAGRYLKAGKRPSKIYAEAVDSNKLELPEGYVKQGDLYVFQPEAPAGPLRISIPEGATSSRTDNVKYQVAGLPDEVVDPFLAHGTDSADAVEALVKSGPRKDTEHYEGRLVPKDDGSPWGNTKTSASFVIISKPGQTTSSPNEIGAVVVNRTSRGDEKTASMIAGMERRLDGTGVAVLTPEELPNWLRRTVSQTTAAEKQTPVPSRNGTGAAGVVQSEPVGGSIPTVEKVSTETESESSEKLDTVAQIDRLVRSGVKPEEMDKFIKSLSDDQFNELVASEAFDVEPKLAIKPKDTYDAKRIKRRKFVDQINATAVQARKTADQIFKEEEAELAKEIKKGEEVRRARKSVIDPAKTNIEYGKVTTAIVEAARRQLQNSGEIPNAILTRIYASPEAFLADRSNQRYFPAAYARIMAEPNVEGLYADKTTFVFASNVGVSDLDRGIAEARGISEEQAAARRVIAHENGHRGVDLFEPWELREFRSFVNRTYTTEEIDNLVRLYTEFADWRTNPVSRNEALEEIFQKKFERLVKIPTEGIWDDIVQFLKRVWRRLTGRKGDPTLQDMKDVVRLLRNAMRRTAVPSFTLNNGGEVKLSLSDRFQGVTPAQDAEYLAAVEAGDSGNDNLLELLKAASQQDKQDVINSWIERNPKSAATMQRMVDEAAKAAGYDTGWFHGRKTNWTIYDPATDKFGGLYITKDRRAAEAYSRGKWEGSSDSIPEGANVLSLAAKLGNSLKIDTEMEYIKGVPNTSAVDLLKRVVKARNELAKKEGWKTIMGTPVQPIKTSGPEWKMAISRKELWGAMTQLGISGKRMRSILPYLGYDSMSYYGHDGIMDFNDPYYQAAVFDPNQIKSADPVTYDDAGNVIPLSQRFQAASPDIRFSRVEYASDYQAASSAGAQLARDTVYDDRIIEMRDAIRRAYEQSNTEAGVAMPLDELYAKAKELAPDMTENEFGNILQDLYEDNGAVLQEGEAVEPLTEQDRRYLTAVESGDLDAAQEFVDKAAGRFASMEEQNPSEFSYGDENDQFFYHVTTKDRLEQVVYDGEGLVPNKGGQFAGAAAQTNSRGKVFFTERSGVKVWMNQVEQQLEQSRDYDEDQSPEDDLAVIRIPKHLVSDKQDDDPRNSPVQVGRDFFSTKPIPAWPETVVRDDQGRIIPLSRRFDTGADIRGQINVTTPEGKRAGFAIIMPKRAVASRVETEGPSVDEYKKKIEAINSNSLNAFFGGVQMKGASPQVRTVKPSKSYEQAAIELVNDLTKDGTPIEDIAESLFSEEFLQGLGIKLDIPALVSLIAEVKNRVSNQSRDDKIPGARRIKLQKLDRKLAGYWQDLGTNSGRSQGIRSYITRNPRYRWMFIFDKAEEQLRKDRELAATRVASDLPQTADNLQKTDAKAGEDAGEQVADDVEQFAESEDDTLLREGETALDSGRRSIWERMKDVLRKLALVARARKGRAANAAKASISKEERDAISQMSDAELAKMESDLLSEFDRLSEAFLKGGTEQQKATRKKMVATAKKRAEQGKSIEVTSVNTADVIDGIFVGFNDRDSIINEVGDALLKAAEQRKVKPKQKTAIQDLIAAIRQTLTANLKGEQIKADQPSLGKLLGKTFAQQGSEAALFAKSWEDGRKKVRAMLAEIGIDEASLDEELDTIMPPTPTLAYAPAAAKKAINVAIKEAGLTPQDALSNPVFFRESIMAKFNEAAEKDNLTEEGWNQSGKALAEKAVNEFIDNARIKAEKRSAESKAKMEKRKVEIADKRASQLIYSVEERFRQGSKDLQTSKSGDSINKAFRDQVKNPVSKFEFFQRLAKLNVSQNVSERLFKTAAREKADLQAMEVFRRLEGPNALQTMLREIQNMRRGEEIPLRSPIPWRKLLSQKASTVEVYRQRIFDAISSEESLADLDDAQKAKLADLFTQAWESKRKAILDRMVDNAINQEEAAGRLTQEGADALRSQRQKLVEDINLGILDEDRLMKHLADKFGIKSEFTEAERANIDRLLDILQDDKLNEVKRNKAAYELLEALSSATKIPIAKLLADYWVSSVLSGVNTAASIAMAVMSGGYELTTGAFRILRAGFTNPKELPAEIAASFKAMAEFLKAFGREGRLAWQYLVTGDRAFLDPSMNTVLNDLNYDSIGKTVSLAEKMAKSDKIMQRVMGIWMRSVSRLLTALDSFNSGVTKAGALPIVFRQLNLDAESLKQATEKYNLQLYRDRVIQRDFNGNKPTTAHDKALVDSYAKAEMMADLQEFGKFSENADFFGQQGAMTLDPTGVGGFIYSSIKSLTGGATNRADKFLAEAEREWKQAEGVNKTAKGLQLAFAYFLQFGAYNSANLAGLRFARFAGNKFNQGLSFIPGIGMFRMYEATVKDSKIEAKDAFTDMILRNQTAGVLFAIIGAMALKAITDEPDDEKRGFFWNGGWANLTPDRKQQKLAAGQKEYTIGIPGGISFNYQNWPISPIMAAIGSLSDLARFSPEQWNEKSVIGRLGSAAASGVFSAGEIPALSGFQTLFGNNLSSKDPNEKRLDRFAKVMAGWGGGFVPRILKDIDFMTDPGLRKYETLWEQTASHIPVYRRYSGEEYYDILGKQIERKVWPGSREFMELETDPEYRTLGKLNSRGIWLTPANAEHRMVGKGRNKRKLTQEEADAYSLETGKGYRQMLLRYGSRLEQMPTERARAFLMDKADEVRDRALKKIVR